MAQIVWVARKLTDRKPADGMWRAARGALRMLVLSAGLALLAPQPTTAFELFGLNLFGGAEDTEADTEPGPIVVNASLTADTASEDQLNRLRRSAALVRDEGSRALDGFDVAARARRDRDALTGTLYEMGHFGGTVRVTIDGNPLSAFDDPFAAPDLPSAGTVDVAYQVALGPLFRFGETGYTVDATPRGDLAAFGLITGQPAEGTAIVDAEDALIAKLQADSFARAEIAGRRIVARHSDDTVAVFFTVTSGPRILLGRARVEGAERLDPDYLLRQAELRPGTPYSPQELSDAEERLRRLPVFDRVSVRLADDPPDASGQVPVIIEVAERKRRFIGAGAFWSSTDGATVNVYWGHRNLFGRAERLRIEGRVARLGDAELDDFDYDLRASFLAPGIYGPATDFTSEVYALREEPDHFTREAIGGSAGFMHRFSKTWSGSAQLEFDHSRITDAFGTDTYNLILAPLEAVYDDRDEPLNPTTGLLARFSLTPAYDLEHSQGFVTAKGSVAAYQAVGAGDRVILAGRTAAGSVFGANLRDVPANRRFFLGGGGSIRGFGFQSIGPELPNGAVTGGLSFVELSGEVRIRVTDTIGIVPFVDAGVVSAEEGFGDLDDWHVGAGLGLRYFTDFGPIRLDVAVPIDPSPDDPDFSIYAGLGQAF